MKTKRNLSANVMAAVKAKPPGFAVLKLPPQDRDDVISVVNDYLAGNLAGATVVGIWREIEKAGIKLTLDALEKYIRARREGRVKG